MKYNAQGQEVADDDPTAISDVWPIPVASATQPVDPNREIMSAYQTELLRQAATTRELQAEIAELRKPKEVPATADEERKFFDTPKSTVTEIIRKEVGDAIKPLNDFTRNVQRQNIYDSLKQQMKANKQGFAYFDQIESLIDQAMANVANPDANSIVAAYNQALGFYISNGGELNKGTPTPSNTPTPKDDKPVAPLPPHARVSPPAGGSRPAASGKVRELTSNEQKIARFNHWDDKHYLFWTEHVLPKEVGSITDKEVEDRIKQIFG